MRQLNINTDQTLYSLWVGEDSEVIIYAEQVDYIKNRYFVPGANLVNLSKF